MKLDELITHLIKFQQMGYGDYTTGVTALEIDFENKAIDLRF